MAAIQLYTQTIPNTKTYQTVRAAALINAINARRFEWAAVDPTLSTKITVSAMFEELTGILEDLGFTNAADLLGTRSQ